MGTYLPRWCGKLKLVTKGDGLEVHNFNNGQKYLWKKMLNYNIM
jgi:hypothetical protein